MSEALSFLPCCLSVSIRFHSPDQLPTTCHVREAQLFSLTSAPYLSCPPAPWVSSFSIPGCCTDSHLR